MKTFETVHELNEYYSDNLICLDLKRYIHKYHKLCHKDLDVSFMDYFLYLCEHPNEIIVEHEKLIEYSIFDSTRSNDIKKRIDSTELEEGVDYRLRNVAQPVPQGGYSTKIHYTLTPEAFKLCLMRSKKQIKYAKYYLFLEMCIHYYQQYQKMYSDILMSGKDKKIERLEKTINEILGNTNDLKEEVAQANQKLDETKEQNEDLKKEVTQANQKLDETKEQNEDLKKEFHKVHEKLDRMEYYIKHTFDLMDRNEISMFQTNCLVLYKLTYIDNSIKYFISSRQMIDILKTYKEKQKDTSIQSIIHLKVFQPTNNNAMIKKIRATLKSIEGVNIKNNTIEMDTLDETTLVDTIEALLKDHTFNAFEKLNIDVDAQHMDAYTHIYKHIVNRIFECMPFQEKITRKTIQQIYKEYQNTFPHH